MCLGRVGSQGSETYGGERCKEDLIRTQSLPDLPGRGSIAEMGMLLPDETYETRSSNALIADVDEIEAAKALAALRRCDEFLKRHGIRPEFFCRHRERLALQAWLLKRSKFSALVCKPSSSNGQRFVVQCDANLSVLNFCENCKWRMCECSDECADDTKTREPRDVM
ncbi:hypothetical protein DMN91_007427 [Ooceraea biroi]|uniref:Uncharacterized protein n=1 Tax=Ooceraea biroi TaxID=2015173 RepID=A0A3L8DKT5_OOCBI|nr:hypothetical protein DMN91_007427 [Ooceraea biroi]